MELLSQIENSVFAVIGDTITVPFNNQGKITTANLEVVDFTKHFIVVTNGFYNFCVSKVDLYFHKPQDIFVKAGKD